MDSKLEYLLRQSQALWRGSDLKGNLANKIVGLATGFEALDKILPARGWPSGAIVEVLISQSGIGELQLLMPTMMHLSRLERWLVWVAPPYVPYAPALQTAGLDLSRLLVIQPKFSGASHSLLNNNKKNSYQKDSYQKGSYQKDSYQKNNKDILWSMEKALRTPNCGMVLSWIEHISITSIRRLQLAAEAGQSLGVLFRDMAAQPSPAALRLALKPLVVKSEVLKPVAQKLQVRIIKARGTSRFYSVELDLLDQGFF